MNTFISIAIDNISLYHKNAVLKDQLSSLQEYDSPTLVSFLLSHRIRRRLTKLEKKKNVNIFEETWKKFCYFLVPTTLFQSPESMKIKITKKDFTEIMKLQLKRYELDTVEKRERVSALIENMRREKENDVNIEC